MRNEDIKVNVGLHFFTLGAEKSEYFHNEDNQTVKTSYVYPVVAEQERLDAFRIALHDLEYNVKQVKSTKTIGHFCEFSGGGDLYNYNS